MMGRFGLVVAGPWRLHGGRRLCDGAAVEPSRHLAVARHPDRARSAPARLALVVAYPCFRFRITGHYFALVTLALSGIVLQVITATRD